MTDRPGSGVRWDSLTAEGQLGGQRGRRSVCTWCRGGGRVILYVRGPRAVPPDGLREDAVVKARARASVAGHGQGSAHGER